MLDTSTTSFLRLVLLMFGTASRHTWAFSFPKGSNRSHNTCMSTLYVGVPDGACHDVRCSGQSDPNNPSRRRLLRESLAWSWSLVATFGPVTAAVAEDGNDPFAQLDRIAGSISSDNKSTFQVLPAPLPKATSDDNDNGDGDDSSDFVKSQQLNNDSNNAPKDLSEMERKLQESRKRKLIDPRTHG